MTDTESSFNTVAKENFNSSLCSSYAFIDRLVEETPKLELTKDEKDKLTKEYEDVNPLIKINELTFSQYEEIDTSKSDQKITTLKN